MTALFICMHKRVESIVFAVFVKFCDESGLVILSVSGFFYGFVNNWENIHISLQRQVSISAYHEFKKSKGHKTEPLCTPADMSHFDDKGPHT